MEDVHGREEVGELQAILTPLVCNDHGRLGHDTEEELHCCNHGVDVDAPEWQQ